MTAKVFLQISAIPCGLLLFSKNHMLRIKMFSAFIYPKSGVRFLWIGGINREGREDSWTWSDGSSILGSPFNLTSAWAQGFLT